nr:MAG TPA: hypothetical protein [Caudoviricetes sp.]
MDYIKRQSETIHTGNDWNRSYTIQGDNIDLNNAHAVCKLRTVNDELILEADCTIQDKSIYVSIPAAKSLTIPKTLFKGFYDVFIVSDTYSYKLVMGSIKIIHDISLH